MPKDATPKDRTGKEAQLVPAVMRAAAMLDLAARAGVPVRLTDFATELGLPKSSVHALCQTLVHLRLLRDTAEGFLPGPGALPWAQGFDAPSAITRAFQEIAATDPALAPYTMTLSVQEGGDVVYLACRNSTLPLGITFRIGMRLPAVYAATGKAFFAAMDPATRARALAGDWPAPLTPLSVRTLDTLEQQIAQTAARGYSTEEGEIRQGMICFGATIRDQTGAAVAAIAVSLMAAEAEAALRDRIGTRIAEIAGKMSDRIAPVR